MNLDRSFPRWIMKACGHCKWYQHARLVQRQKAQERKLILWHLNITEYMALNIYIYISVRKKKEEKKVRGPDISSFLVSSEDERYHWIVHFERSGASSEQGLTRKQEPRASLPSISYKSDTFSSLFLHSASWIKKIGKACQNTSLSQPLQNMCKGPGNV